MSAARTTPPRPGRAPGARWHARALTAAVFRAEQAAVMSEEALLAQVRRLARELGWREYHTYNSKRSTPGFPDLVLVSARQGRIVYAELKTAKGRLTAEQRAWLDDITLAGGEAHVWRPADLFAGSIAAVLSAPLPPPTDTKEPS